MRVQLECLKKHNIIPGKPNFLIGISGNGITTDIENEILDNQPKDFVYINYTQLEDNSENQLLINIANSLSNYFIDSDLDCSGIKSSIDIFKRLLIELKNNKPQNHDLVFIFDQIEFTFEYSNAFFFTLWKLMTIYNFVDSISMTSILISDSYLNPFDGNHPRGLESFFYNHTNFNIIPSFSYDEMINNPLDQNQPKFSEKINKKIYELSGGIPVLINSLNQLASNNIELDVNNITNNYNLEWKLTEIWETIGIYNQKVLESIVEGNDLNISNDLQHQYLIKSGLVDNKSMRIKAALLEKYIKNKLKVKSNVNENYLKIGNQTIFLPNLSNQAEKVLLLLYKNRGKVVNRDEIAETMWGKDYINRYSDYAIDRLIADIRKVIVGEKKNNNVLHTKRGEGYFISLQ